MKIPIYTIDSQEGFDTLKNFFDALPKKIQNEVTSLTFSSLGQIRVRMRLTDHPRRTGIKAIYLPPNTSMTSFEQKDMLFYGEKDGQRFLFEVEIDLNNKFDILHEY